MFRRIAQLLIVFLLLASVAVPSFSGAITGSIVCSSAHSDQGEDVDPFDSNETDFEKLEFEKLFVSEYSESYFRLEARSLDYLYQFHIPSFIEFSIERPPKA